MKIEITQLSVTPNIIVVKRKKLASITVNSDILATDPSFARFCKNDIAVCNKGLYWMVISSKNGIVLLRLLSTILIGITFETPSDFFLFKQQIFHKNETSII